MFILAMMMVMTITANAMSYNVAKNEALFLSDKMAYELGLTDAQYDAVYEINLDYLMSVGGHADVFGTWWDRRNADLMHVLTAWQYNKYVGLSYFYRPLSWNAGSWTFNIYGHYSNKNHYYNARPKTFGSYRGGNNHKGDRYYADKNVDKPNMNVRNGDVKNSGSHRGNPNKGHNDNALLARNSGDNHHASHRGRR